MAATGWRARPVAAQPSDAARPGVPHGVQSGDVGRHSGVVWSATDRPARMIVEYSERFAHPRRVVGPAALPETGHAAQVVLTDLPAGQDVFYRVTFQDLGDLRSTSIPLEGRLKTAPADARDVTFAGRRHLAQRRDPGEGEGGRDARGVPRQLSLQPPGRAHPASGPTRSTTPSDPRSSSRSTRAGGSTRRRPRADSSSGTCASTAGRAR
ncbi:MAG TPA: PhoD-like phosphatase N-terminal domain-containing protein [Methylomirabilota bacterium]|nr:PhoD-like phosphatase N-terminal domain-containing protein [Methylomirabilota bacterium]